MCACWAECAVAWCDPLTHACALYSNLGRPHFDKNAQGTDQYRTIFVGRLSFETTEERLKREFDGVFGEVVSVHIVKDTKTGKSRGYGFVEFSDDREADGKFSSIIMVTLLHIIFFVIDAVRRGDGRRVDGRRIIVDRELGRTKANWYPRRLGGGKGEARRDRRDEEFLREIKKQIEHERDAGRQESVEMRDGDDKANTMMIKTNGDERPVESAASVDQAMQEISMEGGQNNDPNKAE